MEEILKVNNLSKSFDETIALKNINFSLKKGEIHGLVGANGSGKSTFMNIIFGEKNIQSTGGYEGEIYFKGKKLVHKSPFEAINNGFGMVHQEFALLGKLDISSNIRINRESVYNTKNKIINDRYKIVNKADNDRISKDALEKLGLDIEANIKVNNITTNMKQFVEIAREIARDNLEILLLDEPTSSLNQEDTNLLLKSLREIANSGVSIIFVSHRLDEVRKLCDQVTVFRDGQVISTYKKDDISEEKLSDDMIGKKIIQAKKVEDAPDMGTILSYRNIKLRHGEKIYEDISLDIKRGEVLGITSLAGHGQEIFSYGLMGLYKMQGQVILNGKSTSPGDIASLYKNGVYMLSEERKEMGVLLDKAVWENMIFNTYEKNPDFLRFPRLGDFSFLNHGKIESHCKGLLKDLNIKASNLYQPIRELSGGNQQKVCIGRALTMNPSLLFVGEPTRGIDVYSKELILDMLLQMNRDKGITIVISSGELGELKRVCDRILVMYEGKIFGIYDKATDDRTLSLAVLGRKK